MSPNNTALSAHMEIEGEKQMMLFTTAAQIHKSTLAARCFDTHARPNKKQYWERSKEINKWGKNYFRLSVVYEKELKREVYRVRDVVSFQCRLISIA